MKSSSLHLHIILPFVSPTTVLAYICDIPPNACTNGMFSIEKCKCECIEPFCPDIYGDCTVPLNNCGGNPWQNCEKGVNCPWWENLGDQAGSCSTGSKVPSGIWQVYSNHEACCDASFPYNNNNCNTQRVRTKQPTKRPTFYPYEWEEDNLYYYEPEEESGEYESVIPLRFDVKGLPDGASAMDLKEGMSVILAQILRLLSEKIDGLTVSSVEERAEEDHGRILKQALIAIPRSAHKHRVLQKEFSLYYNVNIQREGNKNFGSLMIIELRKSYAEVLDQIQIYSDYLYEEDIELNFCILENGRYSNCVFNTNGPTTNSPVYNYHPQSDGLPSSAIILIVLFVLIYFCCIGSFIIVIYSGDRYDCWHIQRFFGHTAVKEFENDICFDGKSRTSSGDVSRRSRNSRRSRRSTADKKDEVAIISSHPQDIYSDGESRRSRRSRRSIARKNEEFALVLSHPRDPKSGDDSLGTNIIKAGKVKVGRDPSVHSHSDHEDTPDPVAGQGSVASGRRRYYSVEEDDPPPRVKREPTMYVDGQLCWADEVGSVASGTHRSYFAEVDSPPTMKRDPTIFVDGGEPPWRTEDSSSEANRDPPTFAKGQRQVSSSSRELTVYLGENSIGDSHGQSDKTDCTVDERTGRSDSCSVDLPIDNKRVAFDSYNFGLEALDAVKSFYNFETEAIDSDGVSCKSLSVSGRCKKSQNGRDTYGASTKMTKSCLLY